MSSCAGQASAGPAAESHSEINKTLQPKKSSKGEEPRGWITEAEWTIYIQENSDNVRRSPSVVSIYRVPNFLKKLKREAYVPNIVSLGPYHHRSAELPLMGNHKGRALRIMRTRFNYTSRRFANDPNSMDFFNHAREEVVKLEDTIRDIYVEELDCDGNTLAMMLTLDGCFILEILMNLTGDSVVGGNNGYDPVFAVNSTYYYTILRDMLMLENQIPLIVLQKLLELVSNSNSADNTQDQLLCFSKCLLTRLYLDLDPSDISRYFWPQGPVHHLLDLLHRLIVSPLSDHSEPADETNPIESNNAWWNPFKRAWSKLRRHSADVEMKNDIRICCATELRNAGIKFRPCLGGISMIKFNPRNATIYHPRIQIEDSTEVLLRNLIAFEMCQPSEVNYVTCYATLMDGLIDSEADVAVLRRSGIVTHYLGNDADVARLFNSLCKDVTASREDVFEKLKQDVHEHHKNIFKVQLAWLVKEHFSSPWRFLALAAAILLLFLTAVHTIYSVLSFYKSQS